MRRRRRPWRQGLTHSFSFQLKLSVGVTRDAYLLEIEGLFTQGSRPGRTFGESVGAISEMYSSDCSNGIRYQTFATRSDTEFNRPVYLWLSVLVLNSSQLDIEGCPTDAKPQMQSPSIQKTYATACYVGIISYCG